jgi:hypothetical protein
VTEEAAEPDAETGEPTALARRLVAAGRRTEAEQVVGAMIGRNFGLGLRRVSINADWSSLNSVNGVVEAEDGRRYFFKFHQEEGEDETVEEYYRAELLHRAGLPVDIPAMLCRTPGHQILLYSYRRDEQLAGVCLAMERSDEDRNLVEIVSLQRDLDRLTGEVYAATLHASDAARSAAEPVHQLFHNRLVTPPANDRLAGRVERFYLSTVIAIPGASLPWRDFARLRWRINGVDYRHTLSDLFNESLVRLEPKRLGESGAVVAHGDAHNANVWIERHDGQAKLVLFDPAFAGEHVPALLADIKATFHNIFAHPFWLYHPDEADARFSVAVAVHGERIEVEHDWSLSPLRRSFLDAKIAVVWRPLIAALAERGLLPADWQRIIRLALFCCPTLVMNLSAGAAHGATRGRSPALSALSFAIALMAGSEAAGGSDPFSRFLAELASPVRPRRSSAESVRED